MSREAMKQALEALQEVQSYAPTSDWFNQRVEALRAALDAPEPKPVGEVLNERGEVDYFSYVPKPGSSLYTAPRQWVGLTDEEINNLWDGHIVPVFGKNGINPIVFARAIEAKLKEKNVGMS
jgi:hypothetical protein